MSIESVTFANRSGIRLSARVEIPADPAGFVLLAHCFTCSKDLTSQRRLSRVLASSGLGVMSFDFTGLGSSDGDFAGTGFSSQASDLLDAVAFLTAEYQAPRVLVGHSLGGTACLYAARELPDLGGVATIGSPAAPAHIEKLFTGEIRRIESEGEAEVSIGGRPFCIRQTFLDDIREHPFESWIADLHAQLMILHSPVDTVVGVENAERIFTSTRHPKSFVSLRDADHLLSRAEDAEYAGRIIGAWALSFTSPASASAGAPG